jgi:hypothetical protein
MIKNLPEWYRIAAIENISEEILEKRSSGIEELLSSEEPFYYDCVRLYLGKKITNKEFDGQFFSGFNSKDGMYLQDTPTLEKRILAGAIIAQWFDADNEFGDQLAYVLICASFGIPDAELINKDIIDLAKTYLQGRAESERTSTPVAGKTPTLKDETPTAETLGAYVKSVAAYVKNMGIFTTAQLKQSKTRLDRLQEESDIHWWLFRSHSNINSIPFSELPSADAPFILAYELSKLMTVFPAPSNSASFINKSLKEVTELPSNYTIKTAAEILDGLSLSIKSNPKIDKYGNLTPLFHALSLRIENEGDDTWTAMFKITSKIEVSYSANSKDMAFQFFNELVLLSI